MALSGVKCDTVHRTAAAGSSGRRGSCSGSSSVPRECKNLPARASTHNSVSAARAATKAVAACTTTGASVPMPWAARGALAGRTGAGAGGGLQACLFTRKKIDHQNGAVPDESKGKRWKRCRKQGGTGARAVGVSVQARDAMPVARGAGAAHLTPGATC